MEPKGSAPYLQEPATSLILTLLGIFCNINFYGEELLAPCPTPKLEDNPLSAVRDCSFNIFAATLHIWRPFLHLQPEDAPCRGDRDPLIMGSSVHLTFSISGCLSEVFDQDFACEVCGYHVGHMMVSVLWDVTLVITSVIWWLMFCGM
jgi:hypothetical protein